MTDGNNDQEARLRAIESEVYSVKRLLCVLLFKLGATQEEVANALESGRSTVSKMFKGTDFNRAKIDAEQ